MTDSKALKAVKPAEDDFVFTNGQTTITVSAEEARSMEKYAPEEWAAITEKDPWKRALARIRVVMKMWVEDQARSKQSGVKLR